VQDQSLPKIQPEQTTLGLEVVVCKDPLGLTKGRISTLDASSSMSKFGHLTDSNNPIKSFGGTAQGKIFPMVWMLLHPLSIDRLATTDHVAPPWANTKPPPDQEITRELTPELDVTGKSMSFNTIYDIALTKRLQITGCSCQRCRIGPIQTYPVPHQGVSVSSNTELSQLGGCTAQIVPLARRKIIPSEDEIVVSVFHRYRQKEISIGPALSCPMGTSGVRAVLIVGGQMRGMIGVVKAKDRGSMACHTYSGQHITGWDIQGERPCWIGTAIHRDTFSRIGAMHSQHVLIFSVRWFITWSKTVGLDKSSYRGGICAYTSYHAIISLFTTDISESSQRSSKGPMDGQAPNKLWVSMLSYLILFILTGRYR